MIMAPASKCDCEDRHGVVCGKPLSKKEDEQDGMCWSCADNVWKEMSSSYSFTWSHSAKGEEDVA